MTTHPSGYKAYILRIWQTDRDEETVIMVSLEDCLTCQRKIFTGFPALLHFLETAAQQEPPEETDISPKK